MDKTLKEIKKYAQDIGSQWNGDEPGIQEDQSNIAREIIERVGEIEGLLEELK